MHDVDRHLRIARRCARAVRVAHRDRLSDTALLETQRTLAEIRRRVDAAASVVAAEIARRSRPELGYSGLAQRHGMRTPQALVQRVTGSSAREANALLRAGTLLDAGPAWLSEVAAALAAGTISAEVADAIRTGLGEPTTVITHPRLADAAARLLRRSPALTVERLAAEAWQLRAELDLDAVAHAEHALAERRYFRMWQRPDGMSKIDALLDPERAAIVAASYSAATSPRRGGPRFVDPVAKAAADALLEDPRTVEQIAADAFVELIRIGTAVDDSSVLGSRPATVTLHVRAEDLDRRRGTAHFEGQSTPVSIETAQRHLCESGFVPILFDGDGQVINAGREHRLFTRRQRLALAARDGGCRFPHCERPPSWTEAHHLTEWQHGGRTDVADGILLCRHHHLLVHNNGWRVTRRGAEYFVVPPTSEDPRQRPRPAPRKWLLPSTAAG